MSDLTASIPVYAKVLKDLKSKIRKAQYKATISVNKELIILYWEIGKTILKQQETRGWGTKVIDKLSNDLSVSFPEIKGFSSRNLKYMRKFAQNYPHEQFVQQAAAQIPWFHHCVLLDKVSNSSHRKWYIKQTIENGWSRNVLVHQIETGLHKRQLKSKKTTNFMQTLPSPQSDLASQTIKDPYIFDFLNLSKNARERDLEKELINHIMKFLLELGSGFSFVGTQYHLEVGGEDYYVDLLFYHLKLRCYVVIELKTGNFKPEYAGQLNFYLSAVDSHLKQSNDNPSIGIILCKNKNKIVAEYALRNMTKPMGISQYKLSKIIPEKLRKVLPSVKDIKKELEK